MKRRELPQQKNKTTATNLKNRLFSKESKHAEAFTKILVPNFYRYNYRGINILKYGSRGYTFEEGCGVSSREPPQKSKNKKK